MEIDNLSGEIFLVASPIGNLSDITFRAIETLKNVDLIAAEDTRKTKVLLNHYDIKTPLTSYHSFNEHKKTSYIFSLLESGKNIALITDAGTPCLSDPGYIMVRDAIEQGIEPQVIPGVSALTFAISIAGLPVDKFFFEGFLPVKKGKRLKRLEFLFELNVTSVIFESPYRVNKLLYEIKNVFGDECNLVLIREATKKFEEHIRGTAEELYSRYVDKKWKGEFVVIIGRDLSQSRK